MLIATVDKTRVKSLRVIRERDMADERLYESLVVLNHRVEGLLARLDFLCAELDPNTTHGRNKGCHNLKNKLPAFEFDQLKWVIKSVSFWSCVAGFMLHRLFNQLSLLLPDQSYI